MAAPIANSRVISERATVRGLQGCYPVFSGVVKIGVMYRPIAATFVFILIIAAHSASGAVDFGLSRGGVDCRQVTTEVERNWIMLKELMAPGAEDLRRPRTGDFHCIDPRYTRDLFERGAHGSIGLRCFTDPQRDYSGAICCDRALKACTMYRGR